MGLVVTLEAMYSRRAARNLDSPMQWAAYRAGELLVLLLLLKALLYLQNGTCQALLLFLIRGTAGAIPAPEEL